MHVCTVGFNCRLKSFSFKEYFELTLEIPKPLLLADIAVRVFQMDFDPLSPQCRTYSCSTPKNRYIKYGLHH